MATDDKYYLEAGVEEERKKKEKYDAWKPYKLQYFPPDTKITTSTWSMNKNANDVYRAMINARGYEQVKRFHYESTNIESFFTNNMIIRIVMVLTLMDRWI